MTIIEENFLKELEVFRGEAEGAMQFLYALTALQVRINEDREFRRALNRAPLTWRTIMGGLQTTFFIILGRIFDHTAKHNVYRTLSLAGDGRKTIFSKQALANRKRSQSKNADEWLGDFLLDVYVPKQVGKPNWLCRPLTVALLVYKCRGVGAEKDEVEKHYETISAQGHEIGPREPRQSQVHGEPP